MEGTVFEISDGRFNAFLKLLEVESCSDVKPSLSLTLTLSHTDSHMRTNVSLAVTLPSVFCERGCFSSPLTKSSLSCFEWKVVISALVHKLPLCSLNRAKSCLPGLTQDSSSVRITVRLIIVVIAAFPVFDLSREKLSE